jgi:hypothetical protein
MATTSKSTDLKRIYGKEYLQDIFISVCFVSSSGVTGASSPSQLEMRHTLQDGWRVKVDQIL